MAADHPRNALTPSERLHWYSIERVLGLGGFGITYLARDTNLDQLVAIKEYLPADIAVRDADSQVRPLTAADAPRLKWGLERFISEARTLARFDHPNIVRVYSVFEANATAYMVMRYEQGEALNDMLERRKTLPEAELLAIVQPILDGLRRVHEAGFVHRDIQPANIYIRTDGSPVLLDFGAAREAIGKPRTVTIMVAPGYAPFEQYYTNSNELGPWTDIYGLGATLYRAMTGIAPIDAIERSRGILGSTRDMLVPASVIGAGRYSDTLLRAVDHALRFSEKERPQTVAAWSQELAMAPGATLAAAPAQSLPPSTPAPSPVMVPAAPAAAAADTVKRGFAPIRYWLGAGVVAVFAAGIGFGYLSGTRNRPASPPTRSEVLEVDRNPAAPSGGAPQAVAKSGSPAAAAQKSASVAIRPADVRAGPKLAAALPAGPAAEAQSIGPVAATQAAAAKPDAPAANPVPAPAVQAGPVAVTAAAHGTPAPPEAARPLQRDLDAETARLTAMRAELLALAHERKLAERKLKDLAAKQSDLTTVAATDRRTRADAEARTAVAATPGPDPVADPLALALQAYRAGDYGAARAALTPLGENGNATAQYHLAIILRDGRVGAASAAGAARWFSMAAHAGERNAQLELARAYLIGSGTARDPFLAYAWFHAAGRAGAAVSPVERDQARAELQPEQVPQAEALSAALVRIPAGVPIDTAVR